MSISYKILHLHVQTFYNIFTLVFLFFFVLTRMSKAILKLIIPPSMHSPHISYTLDNYVSISYKILHLHVEIVYNFFTLVFLFYVLLTLSKAIIEFTIPPSMCSIHVPLTSSNYRKKQTNKQTNKQVGILARIFELQSSCII